jgi:two-component system NtrC family sensor kinase
VSLKNKADVKKDYGEIPEVPCYPQELNQVLVNILVNAAQAIETEGNIIIRTSLDDGYVEIRISDTGIGIPEENHSRIFDFFFTTKDLGKGTGLGLNVAYNILKRDKGSIGVESEVGKGATFIVRIPVHGRE